MRLIMIEILIMNLGHDLGGFLIRIRTPNAYHYVCQQLEFSNTVSTIFSSRPTPHSGARSCAPARHARARASLSAA